MNRLEGIFDLQSLVMARLIIRELKSHVGELEGVKSALNRELNGLKQSRRNLSAIYSRCMKQKGKK